MAYEIVRSAERLGHIANEVATAESVALDLETTGIYAPESQIRICSLNTGKGTYVIDLFQTQTLGPVVDALHSSPAVVIGQNLKFDQKFLLWNYDLELNRIFDSFRASAILYNGVEKGHNLYDIYLRELNMEPVAPDLGGSDWSGPLTPAHYDYAAEDVTWLPKLREVMKPKLAKKGLNQTAITEFGVILPEAVVELHGIMLDPEKWKALAVVNMKERDRLHAELLHELPHPGNQLALPGMDPVFNLDSPSQMLTSLRRLGISDLENTREMTLAMYAAKYPVIEKILLYREKAKRVSTYGPDYLDHLKADGCIHADFFPFTGAGRYACSKPNLQQIPRSSDYRCCFVAEPGHRFILADYSNIEMRIVAEISDDGMLKKIFRITDPKDRAGDAHYVTASLVTGKRIEDVVKKERQEAKPVNFGLIYGMQFAKLILYAMASYKVALTEKKARDYRKRFFESYTGVARWHEELDEELNAAKSRGRYNARTLNGRLRVLNPDEAYNEAKNTPVQGTGADGLKNALRCVYNRLKKYNQTWRGPVKMRHHVHDEILLSAPDGDPEFLRAVKTDLEDGMVEGMQPLLKTVPVKVEGEIGGSWADKA